MTQLADLHAHAVRAQANARECVKDDVTLDHIDAVVRLTEDAIRRERELVSALQRITDSANDLLNEMASNPGKQGNWGGLAAHVQMARIALERGQ